MEDLSNIGALLMFLGILLIFAMIVVMALWMWGYFSFEFIINMLYKGFPATILLMVGGALLGGGKHL